MHKAWPSVLVAAIAAPLLLGAALLHPATALWGDPRSEAIAHLWRIEMVTDGLFRHGPFVTASDQVLFPDGLYAEFLDPVNLVVYAPLFWLTHSHALAWNGLLLAWIAIGTAGALALARRVAGDVAWSGPLLVATTVLGAFWTGFDFAGRTEYLPALLLPLHLAYLRDALHTDERGAPWRAGAVLGAMALGGWYVAAFSLLVVGPVAIAWAAQAPRARAVRSLAITAAVALTLVLPALLSLIHSAAPMLRMAPRMPPTDHVSMPGRVSPFHELRIPWPHLYLRSVDQPCYPGVAALLIGIAGAVTRPQRRTFAWLALVGWILVWGAGADLALADADGNVIHSLPGLPRLLHAVVPRSAAMTGWPRIGCMVGPIAGLVLVTGLDSVIARWPRVRRAVPAIVALVILDTLSWPMPFELRTHTFDPRAPRGLVEVAAAIPPGAIVLLPHDVPVHGEGEHTLPAMHQHFVLWRRELERPITSGYLVRMDALMDRNVFVAGAVSLAMSSAKGAPPQPLSPACARAGAHALADLGVVGIVLVRGLPYAAEVERAVVGWLGAPAHEGEGAVGWETAGVASFAPVDCPTPDRLLSELWTAPR